MKPSISVIIPVYNAEKYLNECIDSVLGQTFQNFEIIAINDGSTDSSGQILDDYARKHDNIKVIHKKNEGQGYARKVGLDLAQGDFILFLDSDDYYEGDALEKLYDNITENQSDIALMSYFSINQDKTHCKSPYAEPKTLFPENTNFKDFTFTFENMKSLVFEHSVVPWNKIYSKQFLSQYDDFYCSKNVYYEDNPFHIQVMLRAKKISICPYKLYYHRKYHIESNMSYILKSERCFDMFKIIAVIKDVLIKEDKLREFEITFLRCYMGALLYFYNQIEPSFKPQYFRNRR